MTTEENNDAEMWIGWTKEALKSFSIPEDLDIESAESLDSLIDDMADISTGYADRMMGEYMKRFGSDGEGEEEPGKRRRRRKNRGGEGEGK
jgi:hypothetical protein